MLATPESLATQATKEGLQEIEFTAALPIAEHATAKVVEVTHWAKNHSQTTPIREVIDTDEPHESLGFSD